MKIRKLSVALLALSLTLPAGVSVLHAENNAPATPIGTRISRVLSTDIVAYVNKLPIPSFNVDGYTAVAAEDLRHYGFEVAWVPAEHKVVIYRSGEKPLSPLPAPSSPLPVGTKIGDVLYTDIQAFYGNTPIPSYNIGGRTAVRLNDLDPFGDLAYDNGSRTLTFTPEALPEAEHAQVQAPLTIQETGSVRLDSIHYGEEVITYKGEEVGLISEGTPFLDVQWMAGKLGYTVSAWGDGHLLIQKGPYRFDLSKGASSVPLTWFGGGVQEYPAITPPVESRGRLYAHELDLKQLFGYDYDWHNDTRTLNIEYRDFLVKDWGVTESLTNYAYKIEAEGFLPGNKMMPELRVGNWLNGSYTSGGASVYQKAENPGAPPLYRFGAVTPADLGSNEISVVFSSNQRILYQKSVNVDLTMQTVEPIIDWSGPVGYGDFTELSSVSPSKAYQTTEGNSFEVSGQAAKKIGGGITFKVEKQQENGEYRFLSQTSAPFEGDDFHAILPLENGRGLYRITAVSLLSYPRGTGSKEIAKWYVEKP